MSPTGIGAKKLVHGGDGASVEHAAPIAQLLAHGQLRLGSLLRAEDHLQSKESVRPREVLLTGSLLLFGQSANSQ